MQSPPAAARATGSQQRAVGTVFRPLFRHLRPPLKTHESTIGMTYLHIITSDRTALGLEGKHEPIGFCVIFGREI